MDGNHNTEKKRQWFNFDGHREETIRSKTVRLTAQRSLLFEKNTDESRFLMLLLCAGTVGTAAIIGYYSEQKPILTWALLLVDCLDCYT